ncbi:hypothetical protein EDM76_10605 [bacterium]|nr:MAG: hypothetical protein EDM76_10605 [bacterium]
MTGRTVGENLEGRQARDREVIRPFAEPLKERAGFLAVDNFVGYREDKVLIYPSHTIDKGGSEAHGVAQYGETIAGLVASPLADGAAIMTTEMDPPPAVGERIVSALRAAGIDC